MAKGQSTTPIGNLLPRLMKEMRGAGRPTKEVMELSWGRVVGEEAAKSSWPRRLVGGKLTVEVGNSGWMYTLSSKKLEILEGLIELLGTSRVKSLSFRIGEGKNA